MIDYNFVATGLKIIIAVSIFFVWIIRYDHIVDEFKAYKFSSWFRDIVGIIKCTAAVMLLYGTAQLTIIGSSMLTMLMIAAFFTHIKFRHTFIQTLPSLLLVFANIYLIYCSIISLV